MSIVHNTCNGDGDLDPGELCDHNNTAAVGDDQFLDPLGGALFTCVAWGYLQDPGNDVTCNHITCDVEENDCKGEKTTVIGGWGDEIAPDDVPTDIKGAIMNITNWVLGFVAIIATLSLIYGGVLYLTSAGNEDHIATAKKTITYGIIGVVISGFAYAIVIVISTVILSR